MSDGITLTGIVCLPRQARETTAAEGLSIVKLSVDPNRCRPLTIILSRRTAEMELPLPGWMQFVAAGLSIVFCAIALPIIDRYQRRNEE